MMKDYLQAMNARVAATAARKAEQEQATAEAKATALEDAQRYVAGLELVDPDDAA